MQNREYIEKFLETVVEDISISETMSEKAKDSYNAVGKWLGDGDIPFEIKIVPQGSFSLGTTVKPITEKDDYDIDLVCLLDNGSSLSNHDIKNIVGKRLKENTTYREKLEKEGKRCWTLN